MNPCYPPEVNDVVIGFFDGVEKDGMCGAGMVIMLHMEHSFWLRMDVGRGTNTRSELLALWGLLLFAYIGRSMGCMSWVTPRSLWTRL